MSILDNLKGALYQAGESVAQSALSGVLDSSGGVQGILDKLQAGGLGPIVSSWTGAGTGQPISVDQLKSVLSSEHVEQISSQLGLSPDKALAALAEHLPGLAAQGKT
ncbi:MAG TPA: YidB family protein [Rhizomicrobium sp.]|jgi:uncharacterized protein YidB (DUF937 family)|nr:YidB family protein [Rhizomicrobium sp.]